MLVTRAGNELNFGVVKLGSVGTNLNIELGLSSIELI